LSLDAHPNGVSNASVLHEVAPLDCIFIFFIAIFFIAAHVLEDFRSDE